MATAAGTRAPQEAQRRALLEFFAPQAGQLMILVFSAIAPRLGKVVAAGKLQVHLGPVDCRLGLE